MLQPRIPKYATNALEGRIVKSCLEHDLGTWPVPYTRPSNIHVDPRQDLPATPALNFVPEDAINNCLVQPTSIPRTSGIEEQKVDICDRSHFQDNDSEDIHSPNKVKFSRRKKGRGIPVILDSSPIRSGQKATHRLSAGKCLEEKMRLLHNILHHPSEEALCVRKGQRNFFRLV